MSVVELFRALGEPTRLEMVERLSDGRPHTLGSLSKGLNISRQGARKHLQILADSRLIILTPKGRNTVVKFDRHTLDTGKRFIAKLESRWDERLKRLDAFLKKNKDNS